MKLTPEMLKWTPEQWQDYWHSSYKLRLTDVIRLAQSAARLAALEDAATILDGHEAWPECPYESARHIRHSLDYIAKQIRALAEKEKE